MWNCSILTPLTHFLFNFWPSTGVFKMDFMTCATSKNTWQSVRMKGPLPPHTANFQEAAETYNFFSSEADSWEHVHHFNSSLHCWLTAKWPTRCLSLYYGWSRLWCSSSFFLHWQPGSKNVPDFKGNIFKSQVNSQQYTNDSACRYYKTVW